MTKWYIQVWDYPDLYLDCRNGGTRNGTNIIVNKFTGLPSQQWLIAERDEWFKPATDLAQAIDIGSRNNFAPGSDLILWSHHGRSNQHWSYDKASKAIVSPQLNLCMELQGSFSPGSKVVCANRSGSAQQRWKIFTVDPPNSLYQPPATAAPYSIPEAPKSPDGYDPEPAPPPRAPAGYAQAPPLIPPGQAPYGPWWPGYAPGQAPYQSGSSQYQPQGAGPHYGQYDWVAPPPYPARPEPAFPIGGYAPGQLGRATPNAGPHRPPPADDED